jgi:mono/diheme cytochrome c family protein
MKNAIPYEAMRGGMSRIMGCAVLGGMAAMTAGAVSAETGQTLPEMVRPFLNRHCQSCHGETLQEGGFQLDSLKEDFGSLHSAERWAEVMGRISSGEMPPEEQPRPTVEEIARVVEWIGQQIKEGERERMASRPPTTFYRLSREEYAYVVLDLLGVRYDPAAPGEMTPDPDWHGFRRLGSELSLSPSHVEKYLQAARLVLARAYPERAEVARTYRKDALEVDWPNRTKRQLLQEKGVLDDVRLLIWPDHRLGNVGPTHALHDLPPGLYRGRITLSGLPARDGRPPHVALYCKQLDRMLFEEDVIAPEDKPVTLEFETFLGGKIGVEINNEVNGPSNSPRSGRPAHSHVFTRLDDPRSRAPWQRKMTDEDGKPLFPILIFDSIEWEGPIVHADDMVKQEMFAVTDDSSAEDVGESLRRFARRAWRRPITPADMDRYESLYATERAAGESVSAAWKTAMLGILTSHAFAYLPEGSAGRVRKRITPVELASRLSFFLWCSLPDEQLLAAAERGDLAYPEVLASELARLIADVKIDRFVDSFATQWLQLEKVGMFPPDKKLYPDYDSWLEKSMVAESIGCFREVFRRNASIRELLDADWTMVNPRLARFYGLQQPCGPGLQRVALRPEDHRGGLLTQAAVLSLTSDGTRHRPVHRGIWVSETILGKTPNPPPANVDPIEPNPANKPRATIRMKLASHTAHAQCAACHRSIDPLGFAFDNYDAIGRWRTHEFVQTGTGSHPPVDASGRMPDGRPYRGPDDFKQRLIEDLDRFAEALMEKLATYALRRAMTVDDRDQIKAVAAACREDGYQLRTMIEALVMSDLFQKR